jgi:phosphate transport system permease protein
MRSALYARRRRRNAVAMTLSLGATLIGLGWLVLILGALLWQGVNGLSLKVFTEMTPPPGAGGGLLNPIFGSLIMTTLAVLIGTPVGILAGTYMAEYGRYARTTSVVRFINDILLSAPSIIVGLFIYEVLLLVPNALREAAAALGMPRAYIIRHVAYRAAKAGIVTGVLLAIARISGETAPLLFTALNNQFWSSNLNAPMASLPAVIFQFALSPYADWQKLAWTGALIITLAVLTLSIAARVVTRTRRQS